MFKNLWFFLLVRIFYVKFWKFSLIVNYFSIYFFGELTTIASKPGKLDSQTSYGPDQFQSGYFRVGSFLGQVIFRSGQSRFQVGRYDPTGYD